MPIVGIDGRTNLDHWKCQSMSLYKVHTIEQGCDVFFSLFPSEILMSYHWQHPIWCFLLLHGLWYSDNSHRTWEMIKGCVRRMDRIVVLPMLVVMSYWWPFSHITTHYGPTKHCELQPSVCDSFSSRGATTKGVVFITILYALVGFINLSKILSPSLSFRLLSFLYMTILFDEW